MNDKGCAVKSWKSTLFILPIALSNSWSGLWKHSRVFPQDFFTRGAVRPICRKNWVKTYLKWSCFVIGFQKQKRSLFMTPSLERRFLYSFIVFHCYNQPTMSLDSIGRWWPKTFPNIQRIIDNGIPKIVNVVFSRGGQLSPQPPDVYGPASFTFGHVCCRIKCRSGRR